MIRNTGGSEELNIPNRISQTPADRERIRSRWSLRLSSSTEWHWCSIGCFSLQYSRPCTSSLRYCVPHYGDFCGFGYARVSPIYSKPCLRVQNIWSYRYFDWRQYQAFKLLLKHDIYCSDCAFGKNAKLYERCPPWTGQANQLYWGSPNSKGAIAERWAQCCRRYRGYRGGAIY